MAPNQHDFLASQATTLCFELISCFETRKEVKKKECVTLTAIPLLNNLNGLSHHKTHLVFMASIKGV